MKVCAIQSLLTFQQNPCEPQAEAASSLSSSGWRLFNILYPWSGATIWETPSLLILPPKYLSKSDNFSTLVHNHPHHHSHVDLLWASLQQSCAVLPCFPHCIQPHQPVKTSLLSLPTEMKVSSSPFYQCPHPNSLSYEAIGLCCLHHLGLYPIQE